MTDHWNADRSDRLSVDRHVIDGVRVVSVRDEIDYDVRGVLSVALLSADSPEPPLRIVLNLSGVTFMDSSGINVLITAHREASDTQGWLRIAAAQEPVLSLLQMVGVDTFISCYPTIEQALNA
ncbi:STAS domain-containing protein [Streptomyces sp. NPDC059582]|uniref:STAS domain-containing protein n=1 Tax=Streptomyces sp. NPDC059582 TaxID=3346875 RepID=UPI0036C5EC88